MVRGPPTKGKNHHTKGDGKIQSLIPWIGGKQALCRAIISRFPADYRQMKYVEVFGGGGSVILNKERSAKEVFNDFNSHLVNLYRMVRERPVELQAALRYVLNSREDFDAIRARMAHGHNKDPVLWARDFFQLFKQSCHTALDQIQTCFTGVKWFVEGDIKGFFDNIDHEIMIQCR